MGTTRTYAYLQGVDVFEKSNCTTINEHRVVVPKSNPVELSLEPRVSLGRTSPDGDEADHLGVMLMSETASMLNTSTLDGAAFARFYMQ